MSSNQKCTEGTNGVVISEKTRVKLTIPTLAALIGGAVVATAACVTFMMQVSALKEQVAQQAPLVAQIPTIKSDVEHIKERIDRVPASARTASYHPAP